MIDAYIDRGRIQKADALVDDLIASSGGDTPEYLELKKRTIEMLQHNKEACEEIGKDSAVRKEIRKTAEADLGNTTRKRRACSHAQALLHRFSDFEATEYFDPLQKGGAKSLDEKDGKGKTPEKGPSKELSFKVHPNPSNGRLVVHHDMEHGRVFLYDMQGRQVFEAELRKAGRRTLDLQDHGQGLYLLRIVQDGKTLHREKVVLRQ